MFGDIGSASTHAADLKPNIVFILTDDQGYGDLGCYGSATIATPNIDMLCAEGMKFESFDVHNRCSPMCAALMTGCHAHRVGVDNVIYRRERIGLHADEITIAELLQKAGYSTGIVGKWHLGEWDAFNPVNHGFAFFFGFMESGEGKSTAIYRNKEIVERVKRQSPGGGRSDQVGNGSRPRRSRFTVQLERGSRRNDRSLAQHPEKVQELTEIMNVFMEELEANSRPVGELPSISNNQYEE